MKSPADSQAPIRIDVGMIQTLQALFDTGQVSKAALLLGVSQPSVSQTLRRLRAHFDDRLFVRSGNVLQPTPRAMALQEPIARLSRELELLSRQAPAFDPATSARRFVVGITDIAEFMVLPHMMRAFREQAPRASLRSIRMDTSDLRGALERGDLDLAAGTLYGADVSLRQRRLGEYRLVCLTSTRGRWAEHAPTVQDYAQSPHVLIPRFADVVDPTAEHLQQTGLRRQVVLTVANHFAAAGAVEAADLLCTVPEHVGTLLASMFGVRIHPMPLDLGTVVTRIIWHERFHHDPGNEWLRGVLEAAYRRILPAGRDPLADASPTPLRPAARIASGAAPRSPSRSPARSPSRPPSGSPP
jgi:LysR family transcriptional activator of mexEF-oprN operon